MIYAIIISVGVALIVAALSAINLPEIPTAIQTGWDSFIDFIAQWRSFFVYWLSGPIYIAVLTIGIAIIAFEPLYHGIMWVLRKIPALGIK